MRFPSVRGGREHSPVLEILAEMGGGVVRGAWTVVVVVVVDDQTVERQCGQRTGMAARAALRGEGEGGDGGGGRDGETDGLLSIFYLSICQG
jgi:hypothetical protein